MSAPGDFWAGLPLGRDVVLLARDAHGLAAFNKPAGVLSHPNERADERRSLLTARYVEEGEFFEWGDAAAPQRLWLLNRLDAATSGVILAATSARLAATIRAHFKGKLVKKIYHALVFGLPRKKTEVWTDRLVVKKRGGQIRTEVGDGPIPAECRMSVVKTQNGEWRLALIRLEPRTGRSHQLRVQCEARGLPIVGDQTYGDFARNRTFAKFAGTKRLFLHSSTTSFTYEFAGARHVFEASAPLPAEFGQFL
ncbi:MAG: RluA family pseudouridine synthase [Opitutaceae bacterium]|nr:RluA family pseudouridine synthase [Opitutaceae bacterium]